MSSQKTDFIVGDLISKIYQQKFWEDKLPTQRDLAAAYEVSRFTIQKVLKRLRAIGLIQSIQGDGIYIRTRALGNPLVYNSLIEVPYSELQSKMLYLKKVIPKPELSRIFNLSEGEPLWKFSRLRIVRYEINQIETAYMPWKLFSDLNQKAIEDSVQDYVLRKKYKISHFMTHYQSSLVSREDSALLKCKKGSPAMSIDSRGVLKDGNVFIYSHIQAIHYECTYIIPFNKEVYQSRRVHHK